CFAEPEIVEGYFNLSNQLLNTRYSFLVKVVVLAGSWNDTVVVFVSQHYAAVDKITVYSNKFVVVPCLKVLPGEVVVLGLRCIGCKHIAQHVLLVFEVLKVFM